MPTLLELRMIHVAYRQAGLDEEQYRMVLRSVANVESAKALSQTDLENVMAVLEDSGFRHTGKPEDYWRMKVALRGSYCGERMTRKIETLAARQQYDLAGLCRRVSKERVSSVGKLSPREGLAMIEMLKAIGAREAIGAGAQTSRAGVETNRTGGAGQPASPACAWAAIRMGGIQAAGAAGGGPVACVEAGTASETFQDTTAL
jgi:hypothetical protein